MKKLLPYLTLLPLLLLATTNTAARNKDSALSFRGFSGGMLYHSGWVGNAEVPLLTPAGSPVSTQSVSGMPSGLGGALRFLFGNNLRVGFEGYSSNLRYGEFSSKMHIGWGGLLADWQLHFGKFHPYIGVTFGGGSVENMTLTEKAENDFTVENNASFRKYPFMAVAPFIGIEYALNQKIRLVLKTDWMLNVSNKQPDFPHGPRVYFGITFCHFRSKKHHIRD